MSLSILPRPKKVRTLPGQFLFDRPAVIVLSKAADDAERMAATVLAESIEGLGGPTVAIERHGKLAGLDPRRWPTIQMLLIGRDESLNPAIAKLVGKNPIGREGYAIQVQPNGVLVAANSSAGLFYAAQTVIQMLDRRNAVILPSCRIVDWPDFTYRGVMLDVSRYRVPTTETLADLVFRLAACKVNVLQLYVEHTFRCRRHPEYSAGFSPLTAEQLADLDQLCRTVHIELQANQNSLGHLEHVLRTPKFAHLAERTAEMRRTMPPWSFRLDGNEEVYRLLDDIYAEHLTAVRSPLVNLGCDEVGDLGTGHSKQRVQREGAVAVFVGHIKRIAALAKRYGKQPMIWDDMMRNHPEALKLLPRDVIPVYWRYEAEVDPSYAMWAKSGRRHWIAPGCAGWQTIFAQLDKASANLHWMTAAGRRGRAEGVLNTEWGDFGNFQTLAVSYWSMALGADLSWNTRPIDDPADFDRRFAAVMFSDRSGRMGKLYRLLGRTNSAFRQQCYTAIPFLLLWADFPFAANWSRRNPKPVSPAAISRCCKSAEQALALARQIRRDPPADVDDEILEELISAAEQTILACRKGELAIRVRAILAKQGITSADQIRKGKFTLPPAVRRSLEKLAADWATSKEEFIRVWMLRNEVGQIDYRLALYDQRGNDFARLLGKRVTPVPVPSAGM